MPMQWKKLVVSGSNANLQSLVVDQNIQATSITSSFFGDGSQLTNIPTNATVNIDTHTFIGNGVTTSYILSQSYHSSSLFVSVEGLTQTNVVDYSISASVITFVDAPPTQSNILVKALVNATQGATGSFSGIFFGTSSVANSVEYINVLNKPTLFSSSAQLPQNTVSSSAQVVAFLPNGTISSSTQLPSGTVSSSNQVSYLGLSNIPIGIVSGAAQVISLLPTGTVSSSTQVFYTSLSNIPSGIVSNSVQIELQNISGSTFKNTNFTFPAAVTASNVLITGTAIVRELRTLFVTSSVIFESGSTKLGDSTDDVHQVTGSLQLKGDFYQNGILVTLTSQDYGLITGIVDNFADYGSIV